MADQPQLPAPPKQARFRFSLAGLFFVIFGLAVALAYIRAASKYWNDALLACAGVWILIGLIQRTWRVATLPLPEGLTGLAFSRFLHVAKPACLAVTMAIVLVLGLLQHFDTSWLREDNIGDGFMRASHYVEFLFYWVIVCCYLPRLPVSENTPSRWGRLFGWMACGFGILWLAIVCSQMMLVASLVHIAIRGVVNYFPLRHANEIFHAADIYQQLSIDFSHYATVAGVLALISFALICLLAKLWDRGARVRVAIGVGWLTSIACLGLLLWWCYSKALPTLSPYLFESSFRQPMLEWTLGATIGALGAFALAARISVKNKFPQLESRSGHSLEQNRIVMILLITAIGLGIAYEFYSNYSIDSFLFGFWHVLGSYLFEPFMLIRWAAIVALVHALWRRFREPDSDPVDLLEYDAGKLTAIWLLTMISLPLYVCSAAWFGFAMNLATGRRW